MPDLLALERAGRHMRGHRDPARFFSALASWIGARYEGSPTNTPGLLRPVLEDLLAAETPIRPARPVAARMAAAFQAARPIISAIPHEHLLLAHDDEPVAARHPPPGSSRRVHRRQALLELLAARTIGPGDDEDAREAIGGLMLQVAHDTRSLPPAQQVAVWVQLAAAALRFDLEGTLDVSMVEQLKELALDGPLARGETGAWLPHFFDLASPRGEDHVRAVGRWSALFRQTGAADPAHDRTWMMRLPLALGDPADDDGPLAPTLLSMAHDMRDAELANLEARQLDSLIVGALRSDRMSERACFGQWFAVVERTTHGANLAGRAFIALGDMLLGGQSDLRDAFFAKAMRLAGRMVDPGARRDLVERAAWLATLAPQSDEAAQRFAEVCDLASGLPHVLLMAPRQGRSSTGDLLLQFVDTLPEQAREDAAIRVQGAILNDLLMGEHRR